MQLTQLLQKRLKISINAANYDPSNSESIKNVISVIAEIITNQYSIMQFMESEISDKINDHQFKQSLSGKLSIKEFLAYFQKIEKIVEKMENYWSNSQTKTIELINNFGKQIQKNIYKDMQYHLKQFNTKPNDKDSKDEELQQLKKKIIFLKKEIDEVSTHSKHGYEQIFKKIEVYRGKDSMPQQKLKLLANEMHEMQRYFNQSHQQIKQLLLSFNQNKNGIPNLDQYISKRFEALNEAYDRTNFSNKQIRLNRWIWEWNSVQNLMKWQKYSGSQLFSIELINEDRSGIMIKKEGLYRVTFGYFIDVDLRGDIELNCNNKTLHRIQLEGQYGDGLCKTTMLYVWINSKQRISLCTFNSHYVKGFFEIQMF